MTTTNNSNRIPIKARHYLSDWEAAADFLHLDLPGQAAAWTVKTETTAHSILADSDTPAIWGHVTAKGQIHYWPARVNEMACRDPKRCGNGCKPDTTTRIDRHLAGDPALWTPTWDDGGDRDPADTDDPATAAWVAKLWTREPA